MRLKKDLVQLVKTDYVPLQTDKEGLLRGGFGAVMMAELVVEGKGSNNKFCVKINVGKCSVTNNCNCPVVPTPQPTPSATPTPSVSPSATPALSFPLF